MGLLGLLLVLACSCLVVTVSAQQNFTFTTFYYNNSNCAGSSPAVTGCITQSQCFPIAGGMIFLVLFALRLDLTGVLCRCLCNLHGQQWRNFHELPSIQCNVLHRSYWLTQRRFAKHLLCDWQRGVHENFLGGSFWSMSRCCHSVASSVLQLELLRILRSCVHPMHSLH